MVFWRTVGPAARRLQGNEGLLMSLGVGEAPLFHQPTFSVWRDVRHSQPNGEADGAVRGTATSIPEPRVVHTGCPWRLHR